MTEVRVLCIPLEIDDGGGREPFFRFVRKIFYAKMWMLSDNHFSFHNMFSNFIKQNDEETYRNLAKTKFQTQNTTALPKCHKLVL